MYKIEYTGQFRKSLKLCKKRKMSLDKLHKVISVLAESGLLPSDYRPHKLSGKYAGIWECHITSDWLLLWKQDDGTLTLLMLDTGTHSDLF